MDERDTKPRGPITLLLTSRRFRWVAGVLVSIPVLYVACFGPACWIGSWTGAGSGIVSVVYQPMLGLCMRNSLPADAAWWYASIGAKDRLHTARDSERRVVILWEPLRFELTPVVQDSSPVDDE